VRYKSDLQTISKFSFLGTKKVIHGKSNSISPSERSDQIHRRPTPIDFKGALQVSTILKPDEVTSPKRSVVTASPSNTRSLSQQPRADELKEEPEAEFLRKSNLKVTV